MLEAQANKKGTLGSQNDKQKQFAKRVNQTRDIKDKVLIICWIVELVDPLGIDGSDDIHKYTVVSFWAEVAHYCMRELIVASERKGTSRFVTPR